MPKYQLPIQHHKAKKELTYKQQAFVHYYTVEKLSASESAKKAGYARRSSQSLLKKTHIAAKIDEFRAQEQANWVQTKADCIAKLQQFANQEYDKPKASDFIRSIELVCRLKGWLGDGNTVQINLIESAQTKIKHIVAKRLRNNMQDNHSNDKDESITEPEPAGSDASADSDSTYDEAV